jgi:hypothetical protein
MSHRDAHLDAMLRHLGAAYYQTVRGQGSALEVERALESVEDAPGPVAGWLAPGNVPQPSGWPVAGPGRDEHRCGDRGEDHLL